MTDTPDQIQKLADLFLTDSDGDVQYQSTHSKRENQTMNQTCIEIILVGHLPVRAGLWLTQYADEVAKDCGATGLVRLDSEQLILEILRGGETAARASASATLREAVEAAASEVRRWIIKPNVGVSPESLIDSGADVITILSGGDEIAIVGAYRVIKDLHDAACESEIALPPVELAVLGVDMEQAKAAAEKISQTSLTHLGIELKLSRCVRSMGALGSTLHFRFPAEHAPMPSELVSTILSADTSATPFIAKSKPAYAGASAQVENSEPIDLLEDKIEEEFTVEAKAESITDIASPIGETGFAVPRPTAQMQTNPLVPSQDDIELERSTVKLAPKPSIQVEAKPVDYPTKPQKEVPATPALVESITGLAKLPITCDDAKDVEIAVDTSGDIHLVAWEDRFRDMHVTQSWIKKNRQLITMACSDYSIRNEGNIVTHLVTSEPVKVSDLHNSDIHLHVLAPVDVDGKTGWYAAPLNW